MRRIFLAALLLTLGFAVSGTALAAQGDSADNPIIITTAEQLDAMRSGLDKHYKLAADIDLTEFLTDPKGWIPVGGSDPDGWADRDESARFTGSLDGDGHAVTGLWINRDRNYVGLFGHVKGATFKNLRIEIADKGITGDSYVGGLVGYARSVTIANCRVSGNVTGGDDPVYGSEAGGLAGLLIDMCFVTDCGVTGDITGSANGVGGLVGSVASESVSIANCFFEGSVKSAINYVGGLAGSLRGKAVNCYAAGSVTGKSIVGGITGFLWNGGELANSFAMCEVTGSGDRIGEVTESKPEGTFTNNRVLTGAERFSKKTYTDSGWIFDPETGPWQWVEGRYPQLVENAQTTASPSAAARPVPDEPDAGGDAWQDFPSLDDWDAAAATRETKDATEEVSGETDADALQDFPALDSWDAAAATSGTEDTTEEVSGEDDADALQDFPSLDDWDAAAETPETEDATEEVSDESTQDEEDEPDAQDEADAVFAMNFDDDADFAALREDAIRKASEFYDMSDFPQDDRSKEAAPPQAMAVAPTAQAAPAASGVMGERTAYNAMMEDLKRFYGLLEKMGEEVDKLENVGEVERLEAAIGMYRRLGSEASAMLEKYAGIEYDIVKRGQVQFQEIIDLTLAEAKPLQERLALLQNLKELQDQVAALQQQRGGSEPSQAAQTPEPSDPVERLRGRAEKGDTDAQVDLGNLYFEGKGIPQDYAEAVRWYRLAVEQGSARGQNNLGISYANGSGVPMNKEEAARWYRLAADQGLAAAQSNLGFLYSTGQGVSMNKAEAARWYRLAAEQGQARAQTNLGRLYQDGQGVPMNKEEAARLYRLAAEQGDASAQFNLGFLYQNGEGVPMNYAEAARWYRLAAEQGFDGAQSNLGFLYKNGQGVPMNKAEAARLYRLAAEQGEVIAQYNLGVMYANGEGVQRDLDQAEWWLQQAVNQGDQDAIDSLQRVRQLRSSQHYHQPGGHRRGGWR